MLTLPHNCRRWACYVFFLEYVGDKVGMLGQQTPLQPFEEEGILWLEPGPVVPAFHPLWPL